MPGELNRPGSGQSPHMYKAAVGNVKIRLQVVQMIKLRWSLMVCLTGRSRKGAKCEVYFVCVLLARMEGGGEGA